MSGIGGAVLIGVAAAAAAEVPRILHAWSPERFWFAPAAIVLVAGAALGIQQLIRVRGLGDPRYDGLGDMMIHIHSPTHPDSPGRWGLRSIISALFSLVGGSVGPEGAAIEAAHGLAIRSRSRSSRWFEQRRRTDAAMALAAGIAAAFQAPLAAVLMPIELGIGGRTISVAITAISAFLADRFIQFLIPLRLDTFDVSGALAGFHFDRLSQWFGVLVIAGLAGLMSVIVIQLIRLGRDSLNGIAGERFWVRTVLGAVLLCALYVTIPAAQSPPWAILEQVLWQRKSVGEISLVFSAQLLGLVLVLSAFGTAGVFWPLFALGGFLGDAFAAGILGAGPEFAAAAGLAGAASLISGVLGAPLAGAVIAYELTQNVQVLLPSVLASLVARQVRVWLKARSLVERDLEARGVRLLEGRSAAVLDSVRVRDAMVADHETIHELEPLGELRGRLLRSRYPFLPVVNSQGVYSGFITVDMVRESLMSSDELEASGESPSNVPLTRLLEAKDLLYRSGFKTQTVRLNDPLAVTVGMFEEIPCVPVLDEDAKVVGLLFVHHVRLAYDREVARRSFIE